MYTKLTCRIQKNLLTVPDMDLHATINVTGSRSYLGSDLARLLPTHTGHEASVYAYALLGFATTTRAMPTGTRLAMVLPIIKDKVGRERNANAGVRVL